MKFMPRKLLLSLTLTPLTDRFLFALMGCEMPKQKYHVPGQEEDDIYGFNEEVNMWGEEGESLSLQQKQASVESLIILFKTMMILLIYGYSTHIKSFRESNQNFDDQQQGLTKVIDSMIKKIV